MKNIKLNNIIRRFKVLTYIVAVLAGIAIGLISVSLWSILFIPLLTAVFLLMAYLLQVWVEHRYVTYPFERNAQLTQDANKVLNEEIDTLKAKSINADVTIFHIYPDDLIEFQIKTKDEVKTISMDADTFHNLEAIMNATKIIKKP